MNIVFMGTPEIAAVVLKSIYDAGHNITMVVTQPDKPKGRGKEMSMSAVKEYALSVGLPVYQPQKIKSEESVARLSETEADIFVVAAFGQILSKEILQMPKYGCINVHASLLPKYRGASPIQWAIMEGEKETGITIMQMDEGLDTGDILTSVKVPITDSDTGESLHDKLAQAGASLCTQTLTLIEEGTIKRIPQDSCGESSYAKLLSKQMGELDFSREATELERVIRAFTPWPGTYTFVDNKMLKVLSAQVIDTDSESNAGTVEGADANGIRVACKKGVLVFKEVQLEGKKRMPVHDFLLGYKIEAGKALGRKTE